MKLRLLIAVAMLCATGYSQVPVSPIIQPRVSFVDTSGAPCAGCKLSTYAAGTTTPLATYSDSAGISMNTNPVVLDASGGAFIWVGKSSYKFVLKDASGTTIWTVDNVNESNFFPCGQDNCVITNPTASQTITQPTNTVLNIITSGASGALQHNGNPVVDTVPAGNQTIQQPSNTTLSVNSLNSILNATLFSGADIGAKVNAAIAALPLTDSMHCGTVFLPAGTYTQTTEIIKPRCVNIRGAGALATTLNWTPTGGTAMQFVDTGTSLAYPEGELADLTISGPCPNGSNVTPCVTGASTEAILIGDVYPSLTGWGDHQNINRVRILNFGTGVHWGDNAWSTTISESLLTNNNTSLYYPVAPVGFNANSGEAITVVGTRLQNSAKAMDIPGFGDFYFYGSSCDYNATCGTVNVAHFYGVHFETSGGGGIGRMLTVGGTSLAAVEIFGGAVALTSGTGTDNDLFYVPASAPANSTFHISGTIVNSAHPVSYLVNWAGTGANAQLSIENIPYMGSGIVTGVASLTNATCDFLGCHVQDGSTGNMFWNANGSYLRAGGVAEFESISTSSGTGASMGFNAGYGYTAGNSATGYAIYPTGVGGASGIFFDASHINANGKDISADFYTAGGHAGLTSSVTISGCTITFWGGLVTAKSGTC